MRRLSAVLAASIAIPAAAVIAGPATSAFAAPTIVTCGTLSGTAASASATQCNQTAITGGSGHVVSNSTGSTFTITWKSGKTTKGTGTTTPVTPSACPSTFPTEVTAHSTVTGGTAKALIGAKTTNKLCVNTSTGKFRLLPGTKYHI